MAREAIGEIVCKYDGKVSEVRKNEKGKLYLYCPECGIHHLNTPAGQNYILNNATMYGSAGKPDPAPVAGPVAVDRGAVLGPDPDAHLVAGRVAVAPGAREKPAATGGDDEDR